MGGFRRWFTDLGGGYTGRGWRGRRRSLYDNGWFPAVVHRLGRWLHRKRVAWAAEEEVSFYPNSSLDKGIELPSIQSPIPKPSPTSSANTGSGYIVDATSSDADEYEIAPEFPLGNSGLLEDLAKESQALTQVEKSRKKKFPPDMKLK
ncbi:unnamed protein product [Ilex paraguariensis]|uniref:Uncharacterized protein n=1 Tax=Ilex paraguariensis TaxID=185542 RepID=A0ABC8S2B4_9AQUA